MNRKQKKILIRIIITIVLLILLNVFNILEPYKLISFLVLYFLIGYDILKKAFLGIIGGHVFSEDFLMSIATIGAFALAIYDQSGDYNEAIAVMLFYQIGELFQSYAVRKSRKNISELMDIRPDYANIELDGKLIQVSPDTVQVGGLIIVQPGEKIPLDGIIEEGKASLDTIALTGESKPRDVFVGDEVLSGCICLNGVIKIRTSKEFSESNVSKILDLVENASSKKSKSEHFIAKFAKYYTPLVCLSALILGVLPPLITLMLNGTHTWNIWVYRALSFLVISCPCALVISIPLSFFASIGGASNKGVLIKGSNYIETLSQVKYIVFDKTGTLTKGVFEVSNINSKINNDELLEFVAHAECSSSHPISTSIQKAYGKEINRNRVTDIEEISGFGVSAKVDGKNVLAGNDKLMNMYNIDYQKEESVGTIIYVCIDNKYVGNIVISDTVKDDSQYTIKELQNLGIKVVMLTGDEKNIAIKIASDLNIDEVYYKLLPIDKVSKIEEILNQKKAKESVAFVGDGINDAPVLTRADIGISMGSMGSDAAIEASDIVLMDDKPSKVLTAIKICKKCLKIVRENIIFSLVIKFMCLLLGAIGIVNMWAAIFADVGVMVIAILNSIRALKIK